jgi:hypothetical protein
MLPGAQRTFDVLSAIGETIRADDRWRPVFDRYLQVLGSRLVSIGGTLAPAKEPGEPPGRALSGKVVEILYDCFGDFEGFVLDSCGQVHEFRAREHRIWRIVEAAAACRLVIVVEPSANDPHQVHRIGLRFH